MINVIFLDIDGVLNHQHKGKDINDCFGFADDCVVNLKHIIDTVKNVKIVVCSSWRKCIYDDHISKDIPWRQILAQKLGFSKIDEIFIGNTPELYCHGETRADEISYWLKHNSKLNIGTFAILDDECSIYKQKFPNNYIDCVLSSFEGLTKQKANEAIHILTNYHKDHYVKQKTFFIADTHFFHKNIIKYCNRPWNSGFDVDGNMIVTDEDVERMNADMIANWNSVVGESDLVWHLGDFCFGKNKLERAKDLINKLNGRINIVLGNHDLQGHENIKMYYDIGFNRVYDRNVIIDDYIILSHVPLMFLNDNTPFFNIAGHVHDSDVYQTFTKSQAIVCVERHNYTPVSFDTIYENYKRLHSEDDV